MSSSTELDRYVAEHVLYRLRNAVVNPYPFPHFQAFDVFPSEYYDTLRTSLPGDDDYKSSAVRNYQGRRFGNPLGTPGLGCFVEPWFARSVIHCFSLPAKRRFGDQNVAIATDLRLVRDGRAYFIGPHTDAPWKLVSLLFYLPPDDSLRPYGTSLYVPVEHERTCVGGPHHEFCDFIRVATMPFVPNSCVGFWKTDASFHGVEPIDADVQRDVLLWNAYDATMHKSYGKTPE
jgi:hypothetical protein